MTEWLLELLFLFDACTNCLALYRQVLNELLFAMLLFFSYNDHNFTGNFFLECYWQVKNSS